MIYQNWKSNIYKLFHKKDLKKKLPRSKYFYFSLIEGYKYFPKKVEKLIENFLDWSDARELLILHNMNAYNKSPSYKLENKIIDTVTKEVIKEQYQMKTGRDINNVTGRLFLSHNPKIKCKNFNLKLIDSLYPNNNYSLTKKIKEYNKLTAKARKYVEDPIPFITTKTLKNINLYKLSERQVNFLYPFLCKEDNGKEKMVKYYSSLYSSYPLNKLINIARGKSNEIQRFCINSIFKSNRENIKYLTKKYYTFDKVYIDKSKKTTFDINVIYEAVISLYLNNKTIIDVDIFGTELTELVESLEMHIDDTVQNIPKDALLVTTELNENHLKQNHLIVKEPKNNFISRFNKFRMLLGDYKINGISVDEPNNKMTGYDTVFYFIISIISLIVPILLYYFFFMT